MTFLHLLLGFWLGIYGARTFVPSAVWNVSDALPLYLKGGIAVGVHLAGVFAGIYLLRRRAHNEKFLVVALAFVTVLRQLMLGTDLPGAVLSMIAWVWWLAWLATATRRPARLLAPAFACAFALQILTQWLWHGLDLPMARGPVAWTVAAVLSALFVATHRQSAEEGSNLAVVAIGAALFLELTLLANAGRLAIGGINTRIIFALLQIVTIVALGIAAQRATRRVVVVYAIGAILSFALLFAFYNRYEWPLLWMVAGLIILAVTASQAGRVLKSIDRNTLLGAFALAAVTLLPRNQSTVTTKHGTGPRVRVATYNIHQGFDNFGAPAMQEIVREIRALDADVISLQEVNRGWTLMGGADLVAYLRHEFPDYAFVFVPVNGDLCGVALMSRMPISNVQGKRFDAPRNVFGYGYASVDVDVNGQTLHFVGLHLSAGLEGNGDGSRDDQSEQLMQVAGTRDHTVIVGDFNSEPEDAAIQRIIAAGYADLVGQLGNPRPATWPALNGYEHDDYVFTNGGLKMTSGRIPGTLASDHLPVVVDLELDARGPTSGDHAIDPE